MLQAQNGDPIVEGGIYRFLSWNENVRVVNIQRGGTCPRRYRHCSCTTGRWGNSRAFITLEKIYPFLPGKTWVFHVATSNLRLQAFKALIRKEVQKPRWTRILLGRE